MITIDIPGRQLLQLKHLVTDYNGTVAEAGGLLAGVADRLRTLSERLPVAVLTADTFGRVRAEMEDLPVDIVILDAGEEAEAKANFVRSCGSTGTVALGNGFNDRLMLAEAALGLAVIQSEGAAMVTAQAADVWFRDVRDALDALLEPQRIVATLRG
jgi:soluble P-type ATPase